MKKFFADFKKFISRGNIMDMAVGVVVGGAFSAIVTSFTNAVIRPLVNALISLIMGGADLTKIYTYLKYVEKTEVIDGVTKTSVDLANSIYIDWGAFITAVIDFLIIAFTLFTIVKVIAKSQELLKKTAHDIEKAYPNKAERKELKARGVNLKDRKAVLDGLRQLEAEAEEKRKQEEANKPVVEKPEDILKDIRALLQAQAVREQKEDKTEETAE